MSDGFPNEHPGGIRTYAPSADGPKGWVVADEGGWIPGSFDTEETALAAAKIAWGPLMQEYAAMQIRVNSIYQEDRPITMADLELLPTE